MKEKRTYWD